MKQKIKRMNSDILDNNQLYVLKANKILDININEKKLKAIKSDCEIVNELFNIIFYSNNKLKHVLISDWFNIREIEFTTCSIINENEDEYLKLDRYFVINGY